VGSLRIGRQTTIRTWRQDFPYFLLPYLWRAVSMDLKAKWLVL